MLSSASSRLASDEVVSEVVSEGVESGAGGASGAALAWRSVRWGLLIVAALQVWRPFYFLTDDNLVGWLPVVTAVGRQMLRGESPFFVPELFGGFDLLRDPSALCLWNPLTLALALLAQTPLQMAVADIFVSLNLLGAAFCCAHLLALWRARFGLALSDGRLVFLSVSYAFSAFSIMVCASWNTFAPNIAAAPLALIGMFHPRRRAGSALVAASTVHCILVGHLSPFLWQFAFLCLFAALWPLAKVQTAQSAPSTWASSTWGGAWEVPLRWGLGIALGIALCLPLLLMAVSGFANTARDVALGEQQAVWMRVPVPILLLSWLVGSLSALADAADPFLIVTMASGPSHAIGAVAAAHFIVLALVTAARRRGRGGGWMTVDGVFAALAVGVVVLVARPPWLQAVLLQVPLLRSLRFPFREVWLLHLWTHAWMAWRAGGLSPRAARLSALSGTAVVALSLVVWPPPTFTRIEATRQWVVSGRAQRFWDAMRPQLPPHSRLLPVATPEQWEMSDRLPWALLGAFHFPALFEVPSEGGYIIQGIERGRQKRGQVGGPAGLRSPEKGREALERDPNIILVRFESLQPLTISFEGRRFRRTVRPDSLRGE